MNEIYPTINFIFDIENISIILYDIHSTIFISNCILLLTHFIKAGIITTNFEIFFYYS